MKKLISIAAVLLLTVGLFAQGAKSEKKKVKTNAKYCCANDKCDKCASHKGTCPHHKTAMVKEGMYYCPMHPDATSETAATCPKCKMDMVKMEMETETRYCCAKCDWSIPPVKGKCPNSTEAVMKDGTLNCVMTHKKGGKCPKCGMEMGTIEIKGKKKAPKEEHNHEHHDGHNHQH